MTTSPREFIDFRIESSVHASEPAGAIGAAQAVATLTDRWLEMASTLGLSRADLDREVGDISTYINARLVAANRLERDRPV